MGFQSFVKGKIKKFLTRKLHEENQNKKTAWGNIVDHHKMDVQIAYAIPLECKIFEAAKNLSKALTNRQTGYVWNEGKSGPKSLQL